MQLWVKGGVEEMSVMGEAGLVGESVVDEFGSCGGLIGG